MLFESPFNDHYIKFNHINKTVWIDYHYVDNSNPKTYFLLLRTSIDELKNKNFERYQQLISYEDYDNIMSKIKNHNHIILEDNINEKYKKIECDLEDAIDIIYYGMI
jgi:hypothetical protein